VLGQANVFVGGIWYIILFLVLLPSHRAFLNRRPACPVDIVFVIIVVLAKNSPPRSGEIMNGKATRPVHRHRSSTTGSKNYAYARVSCSFPFPTLVLRPEATRAPCMARNMVT